MADEVKKLRTHLDLLREEYVKLQTRLADVERKYQMSLASLGQSDAEHNDNFVSRLLSTVAELFDKELYSDIVVKLSSRDIRAHRFVLAARSEAWTGFDLSQVNELDLTDLDFPVAYDLLQWVYTDAIDITSREDSFLLNLLRASCRFKLTPLADRCETALMSSVTVKNCISYYQTAEEISATTLMTHCSQLISNHWNDFTSDDFESMAAPLAYRMFKSKSQHPLHMAIRMKREDVVFLYLVEHDAQLPAKLDEIDSRGDLALDLALQARLEGISQTLVKHKCDVNRADNSGRCLLHQAIQRGDRFASEFLIQNGCNVNAYSHVHKETALHLIAQKDTASMEVNDVNGISAVAAMLVAHQANINAVDSSNSTPLHRAVSHHNEAVFSILLTAKDIALDIQDSNCKTALWIALNREAQTPLDGTNPFSADTPLPSPDELFNASSYAQRLVDKKCSTDAVNKETGDGLLHMAAHVGNEAAALFLAKNGANVNLSNKKGECPLHSACYKGLWALTAELLSRGANPNLQTSLPITTNNRTGHIENGTNMSVSGIMRQTPLHLAISNQHQKCVQEILDFKVSTLTSNNPLHIIPNLTLRDSEDQSVLGVALWNKMFDIATQLIEGGAAINDCNSNNLTLLHQSLMKQDSESALFLINKKADCTVKTDSGVTCLELSIKQHLPKVVTALCERGVDLNVRDQENDCALWMALETGQEAIASIMVQHGCDTNVWDTGPDNCEQTLLHRAIDDNNENVGCFLIRSMCDVNCTRRPGPNGEGAEEARDGQTPLHLAAAWGLEQIVQCLVEHNADINIQDAEGQTPLHIAIANQHHVVISLLMSHPGIQLNLLNNKGQTAFSIAMTTSNNKAAQAILNREPTAAEQLDNRGRNFLHTAILQSDIESVLFLLSVHCNVNSRVQDATQLTPLHLAVNVGSEIIVRNLLLAGAQVNDLNPQKHTALHMAATKDHASICSVLLENHVSYDALDDSWNNALHLAVQNGHLNTCRALLTECSINAEAINMRGQNPLHVLAQYGKENAAAIFDLFLECMPKYPVDKPDANGNTALLLAYVKGHTNLCKAIVRSGARLGSLNREGLSIFNAPVATKQLLIKLLDMLQQEPAWSDGETCLQCSTKFSLATRKHHCRHCGRLLCSKCSERDMPIIKYNISKPVRVCEICFDVLTLGTSGM